jgi:outer membrane protein assembly factor BamB
VRRRILLSFTVGLLLGGLGIAAVYFLTSDRTKGKIDTQLRGITVTRAKPRPRPRPKPRPVVAADKPCWPNFGGDPQRTLARVKIDLGKPTKPLWARGLGGYIEYPPSYCNGRLYVNTYKGLTYAIDARTGRVVWKRKGSGPKPSTPAIAGDRLIVSSTGGTVTAYDRASGRTLWELRIDAKVESSPVAIGRTAYFGATDGRLFAVATASGRIRWAYQTGGRINSSPSIWGNRICITTYAGSIACFDRRNARRLWIRYIKRDLVRYESFYASASTDGRRLFTIARSGKVVALRASNGEVLWTHELNTTGYSTPAIAGNRVFVGDFRGTLHCYRAATGRELWHRYVGGRILGPAVVIGKLVFFSTLEQKTFAVRRDDGRVVWRIGMGKYSPGIATDRHYYFSLNGILAAFRGASSPPEAKVKRAAGGAAARKVKRAVRHSKPSRPKTAPHRKRAGSGR